MAKGKLLLGNVISSKAGARSLFSLTDSPSHSLTVWPAPSFLPLSNFVLAGRGQGTWDPGRRSIPCGNSSQDQSRWLCSGYVSRVAIKIGLPIHSFQSRWAWPESLAQLSLTCFSCHFYLSSQGNQFTMCLFVSSLGPSPPVTTILQPVSRYRVPKKKEEKKEKTTPSPVRFGNFQTILLICMFYKLFICRHSVMFAHGRETG